MTSHASTPHETICACGHDSAHDHAAEPIHTGRRSFLKAALGGLAGAAALGVPSVALAGVAERAIAIRNINTGESFQGVYWREGHYIQPMLERLSMVLRDHRADVVHPIDPGVIDLLNVLGKRLRTRSPFEVISAYRSPQTNAQRAKADKQVAKNSYHTRGMAMDVRLEGRQAEGLFHTALDLRAGGVGLYKRSGFVHVDVGPVRSWGG